MSEQEHSDVAAATPGPRDSGVAHDSRSAHSLERSGYQEPQRDDPRQTSIRTGEPRRKPGDGNKKATT